MIAASELACHIEIFDKDDYNTTDLTIVAKAQKEFWGQKCYEVRNVIRDNQY